MYPNGAVMKFNSKFMKTITMYWRTGDGYVDGRFVRGAEQSTPIIASAQRLNMEERQLLEEGYRASESYKLFTQIDVIQLIENNETGIVDSAEFEYKGKRFSMIASEDWDMVIPHWKITMVSKK
jgi:hypothetical protein